MMNDTVQGAYNMEDIRGISEVSFPVMKEIYLTGVSDPRIIALRLFRGGHTISLEKGLDMATRVVKFLESSGLVEDGKLSDFMESSTQEQVLISCSNELN